MPSQLLYQLIAQCLHCPRCKGKNPLDILVLCKLVSVCYQSDLIEQDSEIFPTSGLLAWLLEFEVCTCRLAIGSMETLFLPFSFQH